ncbi:ABC transporter substrate-binding protein [Paeniroseomonas aquatica]|uniref:ABC transporter substrate-binding protein n=1 Tax=Paeniroseomonas aquatica TaxID=373043 RepID=UPI003623BBC0
MVRHPQLQAGVAPDKARALLAEAGFGPGRPLKTKVAISAGGSGQMQPLTMNEVVQQNLKDIGIEVDFEVLEWNALLVMRREGRPRRRRAASPPSTSPMARATRSAASCAS